MKKELQVFMFVVTFLLGSIANSSCTITSKLSSIKRDAESSDNRLRRIESILERQLKK